MTERARNGGDAFQIVMVVVMASAVIGIILVIAVAIF